MKYLCVPKADINEGFKTATISRSAIICFPDVFFTIPVKVTNILDASEMRFNGQEIYNEACSLLISGQHAEAYDYLASILSEDHTYYVKMLDKFSIKVGWWIFGSIQFRKTGGMRKTASVLSRAKREEMHEMYRYYVQ
ncbi:MAG: hypothetical protein A2W93_03305 [Bacteroidetes bacterium GWF2_43_63]|nr:MAG: hypothetical protein A2W94_09305 [Bacteroidetes bacterium GWE2_42_42]OFY53687.1 MAG: hypothetical protein A2W93_03305 [Bacteroidetes bacterium GWF2_43_63]HBG70967.1 hypothetical protein [Bacteroidales bacterium]HCB62942.1 hypothetical protein [Bacteroidales bacterium]HCY24294.1 hypothetical protein [Bacteroidales bacterium]